MSALALRRRPRELAVQPLRRSGERVACVICAVEYAKRDCDFGIPSAIVSRINALVRPDSGSPPGRVDAVLRARRETQIGPLVVISFAVDVVDDQIGRWPFTGHVEPRQPMRHVFSPVDAYSQVAIGIENRTKRGPFLACSTSPTASQPPRKHPRFGIVDCKLSQACRFYPAARDWRSMQNARVNKVVDPVITSDPICVVNIALGPFSVNIEPRQLPRAVDHAIDANCAGVIAVGRFSGPKVMLGFSTWTAHKPSKQPCIFVVGQQCLEALLRKRQAASLPVRRSHFGVPQA